MLVKWIQQQSKTPMGRSLFTTVSTVGTHLQRIRQEYADVGRLVRTKLARAIQDGLVGLNEL